MMRRGRETCGDCQFHRRSCSDSAELLRLQLRDRLGAGSSAVWAKFKQGRAGKSVTLLAEIPGFLGTRASLMLDVVFLAMFLVVPVLAFSIYLVRRGRYALHRKIQLVLGAVLLVTVLAFELDLRFFTDWRKLAEPSPYYHSEGRCLVWTALMVHLTFAVPVGFLWAFVIVQALRKFPYPPTPGRHSRSHKFWGWLAVSFMVMTAITGWTFYWLAFVA